MIYLDNAATTQILPEVLEAMMPYLTNEYGNAGSLYSLGRRAADAVATARKQVADCIGAKPEQIIFTSGGTEANNLVFKGLAPYLKCKRRTHLITTKIEHDSVLNTVKEMNIKSGFDVTYLDVRCNGQAYGLERVIKRKTGLVSMMYVNNEIGSVNDIKKACEIAHSKGVLFHSDCVQALGDIKIDVKDLDCDFVSISSHKIHGAKGVGALYVKNPELLSSLITGGADQEYGLRGGTENVSGIVGFGRACELLVRDFDERKAKLHHSKKLFINTLLNTLISYGLGEKLHGLYNGRPPLSSSKILNYRFVNIDAQSLLLYLDSQNVCVSAGSACRSHESEPSSVLLAIGLTPDQARSSIRFSFSHLLADEEVIEAATHTADGIKLLLGGELNG